MLSFLSMGVVLGLSAGLTPGPLFALVISETFRHGVRAGTVVAMAPLITDLPIICISVYILGHYTQSATVLGVIPLFFGGGLGGENFQIKDEPTTAKPSSSTSLKKAVIANSLSPHPYLFWVTVGAPVINSSRHNYALAAAFVVSFYVLFVGSKTFLAMLPSRSRNLWPGRFMPIS